MTKVFNFFMASILVIFTTCTTIWADTKKPSQCMFLIDGSLSYTYLDKAKENISNIIANDNNCVKIYVRWISDDSYADKNNIASAVLNDLNRINNPFGINAKKMKGKLIRENHEIKKNIINAVNKSKSPKSNLTDIYGALMASSARFSRETNLRSLLFIFSDLEDDAKRKNKYNIRLDGVYVYAMDFQTNDNSEILKSYWMDFFKKAGAASLDIRHIDEPLAKYTR